MPPQVTALLVVLGIALLMLSFDWFPADAVGLGVMLVLILGGLVPAQQAFAGFGSDTVMLILGLLILTAALQRTGAVEALGRRVFTRAPGTPRRLLLLVTAPVTLLSSFISNTATTAVFLPIVTGFATRVKMSVARLLMPLAFAAILASSVTLVGSSTNIVISGLLSSAGMPPLSMFELTRVGVPIAVVGLVYLLLVGRRLIPDRTRPGALTDEFGMRQYLSELIVQDDSPLVGKSLQEAGLGDRFDLTVLRVLRGNRRLAARSNTRLGAGDVLLVEAEREDLLKFKSVSGVDIKGDFEGSDPELQSDDVRLAEVILLPGSPLIGRTLKGMRFRTRYELQVLAVNHRGGTIHRRINQLRLRMGDVLLVQGDAEALRVLDDDETFEVLGAVQSTLFNTRRAPVAVGIFVVALAAAALNLVALPVAVLTGAVATFLTRCITPEEAYRHVQWNVLVLIGSMLAIGAAMQHTGTATFLASNIVSAVGAANPIWLLSAFFGLTVLLTQPMSNQAAAVVVLPIAIQTALQLGLNPRTFAIMIAVAASTSFITPLEPACLMVYGPGRYRFFDFVRVGAPLTVVIYLIAIWLVPLAWPLRP